MIEEYLIPSQCLAKTIGTHIEKLTVEVGGIGAAAGLFGQARVAIA